MAILGLNKTLLTQSEEVVADLRRMGLKLALAESCTGGLLAALITTIPGASEVFERGYVTYSNLAKIEDLGVLPETLMNYGAVSPQVAEEMAMGALDKARADLALSITGFAGPQTYAAPPRDPQRSEGHRGSEGRRADKPAPTGKPLVGMVYFGVADKVRPPVVRHMQYEGERQAIRSAALETALILLLTRLTSRWVASPVSSAPSCE
jgi:nicotinamide mononucleotide (NMN) deamidase PncC